MLYAFFWVIPQCLNFICRRFRTLCLFHLHRQVGMKGPSYLPANKDGTDRVFRNVSGWVWRILHTYPPLKMEQTECSETSAGGSYLPAFEDGTDRVFWNVSGWVWRILHTYPPLKTEQTECSETSAGGYEGSFIPTRLWRWNRQSVPKRQHINFRRRGNTQRKTHSIQNTAKVWNKQTWANWCV